MSDASQGDDNEQGDSGNGTEGSGAGENHSDHATADRTEAPEHSDSAVETESPEHADTPEPTESAGQSQETATGQPTATETGDGSGHRDD